jgi:PD-(D/E)XK nuclease superfamily protein
VLTTDQKGAIARDRDRARGRKARNRGPEAGERGAPYDLVLDVNDILFRVQVKWAPRIGDVIVLRCYSNCRSRAGNVRRLYSPDEIDAYAAYCPELDKNYFLPMSEFIGQQHIQLRLAPARNNQRRGIVWAKEYEFAARLGVPGAVAQLGERRAGSAKVRGSSPLGSIDSVG